MYPKRERGVRLPLMKKPVSKQAVMPFTNPVKVFVPLGAPGGYALTAAVGDAVPIGAALSTAEDVPLCSVTGTFEGVRTGRHPLLGDIDVAVIGSITETAFPAASMPDPATLSSAQILALIRTARVFNEIDGRPLIETLRTGMNCDLLIADAVESEPYASSAWVLLRDHAAEIAAAMAWLKAAIGADRYQIAVQNKRRHIRRLREICGKERVFAARRRYPVDTIGRFRPNERVCTVGVQAVFAAYQALTAGIPHTTMTVTVAGSAILRPTNLRVPIGTPAEDLLRAAGRSSPSAVTVFGDALTGIGLPHSDLPLYPGVTCLLALADFPPEPRACVGCGRCAAVCHRRLLPYAIADEWDAMHYEELPRFCADRCDGCGACSYVCPSDRDVAAKVIAAQDVGASPVFRIGGDADE